MSQAFRQNLVYVLDDDPEVSALICHFATSAGMLAQSFEKPLLFLNAVKAQQPTVAVLDIALGKADAIEVIRKLKQISYSGRVLIISGHSDTILRDVHEVGMSHGLSMIPPLRKPFQASQFRERLVALAESKQLTPSYSTEKIDLDLLEAIKSHWLELWYQPKIDLASLTICGAEALVRLRHPKHGILSPADFLPPPSDPLMEPISIFVLSTAMNHLKLLLDRNISAKISVNMPVSIVTETGFVCNIRMGLPTSEHPSLIVEVTEDEVVKDSSLIREVATQLKILNVAISIDDFGVAHASLARLQELPCDEIKLDRKFVSNCSTDRLKRGICQTVADLARRLDVSVCAEGVETAEDLKTIIQMGFNTAQGFLFSKPMPFDSFVKVLEKSTADYAMNLTPLQKGTGQPDASAIPADAAKISPLYEQHRKLGLA